MKYGLSEIAKVCGGGFSGADSVCGYPLIDSRTALAGGGAVFFAIAGANHDGHAHISELYSRGVRAFVTERDVETTRWPEAGFVRVTSSVEALQTLAAHHRARFDGKVVGITGSNGKTVVKEWAAQLAPPGVKVVRSPRSYNSQIGVPLSVLMIAGDEDVAIIEAGVSLPGEMERLERIIRPDVGVMTSFGEAHQEGFASRERKLDEKLVLFRHAGTVIYNGAFARVEERLKALYPSARLIDAAGYGALCAIFDEPASRQNAAAALALWDALGHLVTDTGARLRSLQPVAMRLELRQGIFSSQIIDDSYNSDIDSLGIALDYQRGVAGARPRTLIISDILQSGIGEEELYGRVAEMIRARGTGRTVGIGERIGRHAALFPPDSLFYASTDEFLSRFDQRLLDGGSILIKGNRGSRFEALSHALSRHTHTTTLEVDLDAMAANLTHLRSRAGGRVRVMAMIKAFAYGNGGAEVASMLVRQGVDYLAVAFADEGAALRAHGIDAPIVVLNADQQSFEMMIHNSLEPEIYSFSSLEAFRAALSRHSETGYPIHVKLDTGMHRLGFVKEDIPRLADELKGDGLVRVASLFSHLAAADDRAHDDFTRRQIELFTGMAAAVTRAVDYPVTRHIANSAGVERFPDAAMEMVRLGIGLYGISSSTDGGLRPVSTLQSRIVQIKSLVPGDTAGYGRAGRIVRPSRIATVPIGYADGLDRGLGEGRWAMLAGGGKAPTVGRICMDTCMIDVTGLDVAEGDSVTVFSPAPDNRVEDMARVLGTIPYEVMTGISARVKRIFVRG